MKTTHTENHPILFLDSGIGGIPYCRNFLERNPGQNVVYLADRQHFPYGKRKPDELAEIVVGLVGQIAKSINIKIVILACNTATIACLSRLRKSFPALSFVGTVPAVKPASLASKTKKIGVLGTEITIREPYIRELAARHGGGEIIGIAAPELVEFVEDRLDSSSDKEKRAMAKSYLDRFRKEGVDVIVLGCTHFLFLLEEFRGEAVDDITVFESVGGISARIESLLDKDDVPVQTSRPAQNLLLLTGNSAPETSWTQWADRLGFKLLLLEEL